MTSTTTPRPATVGELQLTRLAKTYAGSSAPAVDGVSLAIPHGQFVTLLGPSGCGKTTTLRMIAGFEEPTEGSIVLDGRDLTYVKPNHRPMAMVFQNYALFPHMNVEQNVEYGLRTRRRRDASVKDAAAVAIASMNLAGFEKRSPGQLSGGQQQRVALARAMVLRPTVMLFDEPLSNLDAKLRDQMRNEIKELQARLGTTSIYVTHDQSEAMSLSDVIVVMNKGRIEQAAPPSEIYTRPATAFVADFIGRASFVPVEASVSGSGSATSARVSIFGREVTLAAHPDVAGARRGLAVLRPEALTVTEVTGESDGTVASTMYFGGAAEYQVDTALGTILVSVPSPHPSTLLAPGTRVRLTIAPDLAYLLPASEADALPSDPALNVA
jgi:iron(III) transport system ATP-binding protein